MKRYVLRVAARDKNVFEAIGSGKKKIETRAGSVKYQNIKAGDTLVFSCAGKKFEKKIKEVRHFKSIADILKVYKPSQINPSISTKEEMIKMWHSFPNYKEKIVKFGILAFELK